MNKLNESAATAPRSSGVAVATSLPNLLTYARIAAVPALVACFFLLRGDWAFWTALAIFVAASITDFFDGYLARAWHQQSRLGRMLDPIADKLLVAAALFMLVASDRLAGGAIVAALVILCREFVIADIPGVIEGAAEGAGLGIQFLKHLSRTRLLLHLVDIAPIDDASPADAVRCIEAEVGKFGHGLAERERWLVLTKRDLLDDDAFEDRRQGLIAALDWRGPVFAVSSVTRQGLDALIAALAAHLERLRKAERPDDPEDQPYDPVTT